jgi:hypothetical protein
MKFKINKNSMYILFDWSASAISFLTLWYIYRSSKDIVELGYGGWLLNVFMTALFISSAAQYYAMFRSKGILNTYIQFVPILVIEIVILAFVVDFESLIIIGVALLSNVLFASFRGHLLGTNRMAEAAIGNIVEQLLRFAFLVILIKSNIQLSKALLLNNLLAYICTMLFVVVYVIVIIEYKSFKFYFDKEVFWYAIVIAIINFIMSGDILSLKNTANMGDFVLVKPWGQIFLVLLMPLINILLVKLKQRESYINILIMIAIIFVGYMGVGLVFGNSISRLVFGFEVSSSYHISAVILEHLFIGFILVLMYKSLSERIFEKKLIISIVFGLIVLFTSPMIVPGINYFILCPLIFGIIALVNMNWSNKYQKS